MNIESNGLSFHISRDKQESDWFFQERVAFIIHFYEIYSESYKKLQQLSHIWVHYKYDHNTYPLSIMNQLFSLIRNTPFEVSHSPISYLEGSLL